MQSVLVTSGQGQGDHAALDKAELAAQGARAGQAKRACPFLNTAQAAFFLGLSSRTLEKMRLQRRGPTCRRHGRQVRYHIADLEAWSEGHDREDGDE